MLFTNVNISRIQLFTLLIVFVFGLALIVEVIEIIVAVMVFRLYCNL